MRKAIYVAPGIWGYDSPCPEWLKIKFRERVSFICQDCGKHEDIVGKLQPHRIIRGCGGGLYVVCSIDSPYNNVKSVCRNCHEKYHFKEGRKKGQ